ncbi:short-subunit dehydrogenase [Motilibacter peucedani]|uniref:Short-subunit dehydrogenase n=1 Tax=Motilibacter peucedani TaxID=598650 RepID=A0A420XJV9_9ACTN|nr:SDR family oxidoreductase [Motilibacter peucedani]RKS68012.1 short-subunit dehydrogenase [Motilibacter peucedani]
MGRSSPRTLDGRVVLVTGGSAGIGRAVAETLHARGATVAVCARGAERLRATAQALPGVQAVVADLTVEEDRTHLFDAVLAAHGRLDAVVLNAGQGWVGLVEDMPASAAERMVAVNLTATVQTSARALPHLLERGGDLVFVSSVLAWCQVPPFTVYAASKAGVAGYVRGLRREVTGRGVRVHTVNPMFVATEWLSDSGRASWGIPPRLVAAAVARCLTSRRSRTLSVPRVVGAARLGEVWPVDRALDVVVSARPSLLAWTARKLAR